MNVCEQTVADHSAATEPGSVELEAPPSRRRLGDPLWMLAASGAALLLAAIALSLWDMKLHVPLFSAGDALYQLLLVETATQNAWIGVNPDIGAPFGGALFDHVVAFGDVTQILLLKGLGLGSSDPVAILNAAYILGYPIVAAVTFLVLRGLGFGRAVAFTGALVYALMPYHFLRGESHLQLGMYWAVPVAGWLLLGLMGHVTLFERRADASRRLTAHLSRRTLLTVLACVIVGASGVYYAVFLLAILAITSLLLLLAHRTPRRLLAPAAVGTLVLAVVLLAQSPQLVWHAQNGANEAVAQRSPIESEVYGLKFASLVTPPADHHIEAIGRVGGKYWPLTNLPGEGPNTWLGSTMTVGLAVALLVAVAAMVGRQPDTPRGRMTRDAGILALVAIAIGSIGGLGTVFAYLVSPQMRGWDRISVYVGFFAVVGLAAVLNATGVWLKARRGGSSVAAVLVAILVAFAAYDQTTPTAAPDYPASLTSWSDDARFVAAIDAQMPPEAEILQLPYVPFPEHPPVVRMTDYDQLKGVVHSDDLRFSYGAAKGREPDDWRAASAGEPNARLIPAAVAAGFSGVWVDTFGYGDSGAGTLSEIEAVTGAGPSATSRDRRHVFYDLAVVRRRIDRDAAGDKRAVAQRLLNPSPVTYGEGFYPDPEGDGSSTWHWARSAAVLDVGAATAARSVSVSAELATPGPEPQRIVVALPDGTRRTVRTRPGASVPFRTRVRVRPGATTMRLATGAPDETSDPRDLRLRVINLEVLDESTTRVAAAARP